MCEYDGVCDLMGGDWISGFIVFVNYLLKFFV